MPVVYHRDRPPIYSASGRPSLTMVVNQEVGATALSVWIACHAPGEVVPLHTHDVEEVLTFLEGEGIATVGDTTLAIQPDMSLIVPSGVPHGYRNTGPGPLRIVITLADPAAPLGRLVETGAAVAG
ncbi:MAG TPA: cupin domain-containing protein [Chloroflexota bacterium]|nr:cupin domain-containing protein [Chloroflexota bacterium]